MRMVKMLMKGEKPTKKYIYQERKCTKCRAITYTDHALDICSSCGSKLKLVMKANTTIKKKQKQ